MNRIHICAEQPLYQHRSICICTLPNVPQVFIVIGIVIEIDKPTAAAGRHSTNSNEPKETNLPVDTDEHHLDACKQIQFVPKLL